MSYLIFEYTGLSESGKTMKWTVKNSMRDFPLGTISWYARWRKYAWSPATSTVFDSNCLREITEFLDKQNREHRG